MAGNEIATVEKEIEAIYNGIKKLATDGSALERFRRFDEMYQRTRLRERTTLVFCGKSSSKVAPTADSAAGFGVVVADCRSRAASCSGVSLAVRTISLTSAESSS